MKGHCKFFGCESVVSVMIGQQPNSLQELGVQVRLHEDGKRLLSLQKSVVVRVEGLEERQVLLHLLGGHRIGLRGGELGSGMRQLHVSEFGRRELRVGRAHQFLFRDGHVAILHHGDVADSGEEVALAHGAGGGGHTPHLSEDTLVHLRFLKKFDC
jgi:hypothetical protein